VIDFVKDKELHGKSLHAEKPNGMQEVGGSIPPGSTIHLKCPGDVGGFPFFAFTLESAMP
jgi:hypothetical protein